MRAYIITEKQIEELNRAHGGMKIVTSWLSCYAIWDTSNTYPVMKSEHVAVDLPEIVRCGDCARLNTTDCPCNQYPLDNGDGYCAWAVKRKEHEHA